MNRQAKAVLATLAALGVPVAAFLLQAAITVLVHAARLYIATRHTLASHSKAERH